MPRVVWFSQIACDVHMALVLDRGFRWRGWFSPWAHEPVRWKNGIRILIRRGCQAQTYTLGTRTIRRGAGEGWREATAEGGAMPRSGV